MECKLVLNNRRDADIPDGDMCGRYHQQLKYSKFRRVKSKKTGKTVFFLFFRKEEDTYFALRAAKSMWLARQDDKD